MSSRDARWTLLPGFLDAAERAALRALAARAGWEAGRLGTGYEKLALGEVGDVAGAATTSGWLDTLTARTLAAFPAAMLGHDRYLLRYRPGASAPPHRDPPLAAGRHHLRLNAIVAQEGQGGVLLLDGTPVVLAVGDAVLFRPDLVEHAVTTVVDGTRLVWSVGCNY